MAGDVHSTGYDHPWSCTQCGICAAVCPTGAITQPVRRYGYVHPVVDAEKCNGCRLCVQCCPGPRVVEQEERFPSPAEERRLYGPFETAFLAHASDEQLRWRGSSGGVVTALLVHLLQSGAIKGAIVTDAGAERCLPRTFVATTVDEILGASGSKYCITSIGQAVRELADMPKGQYAVVGLPCQIQGLWRAEQQLKWLRERIGLRIALFCAGTRDTRYRSALVARMGLREEDLAEFAFRGDGWPGWISGRQIDGEMARMESMDRIVRQNWAILGHTPPRCLLCDDPLGALSDVAVGDPWNLGCEDDKEGQSVVLVRTPEGGEAINKAAVSDTVRLVRTLSGAQIAANQEGVLWRRYYSSARIRLGSLWCPAWRHVCRALATPRPVDLLKAFRTFAIRTFEAGR